MCFHSTLVMYLSLSRVGSISKTYLPINFSGSPNCSSMGSILLPVVCTLAGVVNICAAPPRGKALSHKGNSLTSSHEGGRRGLKADGKEERGQERSSFGQCGSRCQGIGRKINEGNVGK